MSELRRRSIPGRSVRTVRRVAALGLLCLVLSAPVAVEARTRGTGSITGEVTNGSTDKPQGGVEIRLLGGRETGEGSFEQTVERTVTTGARGRFEFTELPSGRDVVYALDAFFDGGSFAGGVVTLRGDGDVIDVSQRVWNTTTDPRAIVIEKDNLFVLRGDRGADVIESFTVVNVSEQAYIGRGAGTRPADEPAPTLSFSLPGGARRGGVRVLDSDLEVPRLLETDTGIGITSAIPPDETNITLAYSLPVTTGRVDITRRALYPILNLNVFAEDPFVIESDRLIEDGDETIEGTSYKRYRNDDTIDEGTAVQIAATAEADGDPALVGGAVVAGLVVAGLVAFALVRRRARPAPPQPSRARESRDDLLVAIARLDLEYRNGTLNHQQWRARRGDLKARLAKLTSPEPTP